MTEEEIQEIVDLVLQALATNSKTIEQLTNTLSAGDSDYLELSGGKKISFTKLAELVNAAAIVQATGQSETKVISQKVVTAKLGECAKLNDERQDIIASSLTADIITLFGKVLSVGVDGSIYIDETKLLAATDIVQTTGTSTTAVMSQKAVSDKVGELETEVSTIEKVLQISGGQQTQTFAVIAKEAKIITHNISVGDKIVFSCDNIPNPTYGTLTIKTQTERGAWVETVFSAKPNVADWSLEFVATQNAKQISIYYTYAITNFALTTMKDAESLTLNTINERIDTNSEDIEALKKGGGETAHEYVSEEFDVVAGTPFNPSFGKLFDVNFKVGDVVEYWIESDIQAFVMNVYFTHNDGTRQSIMALEKNKVAKMAVVEGEDVVGISLYASNPRTSGKIVIHAKTVKADIPSYYFAKADQMNNYMTKKISEIANLAKSAMPNGDIFYWISDIHWKNNSQVSPALVKYLNRYINVHKFVNTGDNEDGYEEAPTREFRAAMANDNVLFAAGNHEYMTANGVQNDYGGVFYSNKMHINADIVEGKWYYIDNVANKTRYIFLESFGELKDGSYTKEFTNDAQYNWFVNSLNVGIGWSILVFCHYFYSEEDGTPKYCFGAERYDNALSEYMGNGTIVGIFEGHTHKDCIYTTPRGIKCFNITCDKYNAWIVDGINQEPWLTSTRFKGTITEQAFDVVIINKKARKVSLVRIGYSDEESGIREVQY